MVATQENDFQNGRRTSFWKACICLYLLHQLANLNDRNVHYEVFEGAESIGRDFEMTRNKDHAKFKMAAILLYHIETPELRFYVH